MLWACAVFLVVFACIDLIVPALIALAVTAVIVLAWPEAMSYALGVVLTIVVLVCGQVIVMGITRVAKHISASPAPPR